ncbi:cupin-like domain-containing protein [Mucilaginibacter lappiensis]|uniref:JmjC domain-containing protein n=1 Tax=Mucilaginibacter lappiensis TaxID=354630 RepID=A0A841JG34_9SPHI|nr:cupin-like domain-containing protein [Mucilaginibacter lappiensis]MBB6127425.1 hypothetical protein [Mucilaginibacter lappiensis]
MRNYQTGYSMIDTIHNPDKNEFNEKYGKKGIPVLLKGIMDNWAATTKWDSTYFKTRFTHTEGIAVRNLDTTDKRKMTIGDYFNYMESTDDLDPYYLKNTQFHLETDMTKDYVVPSYFTNCLDIIKDKLPLAFQLSWMYIGSTNTFSGLHLDIFNTSAWNAVISGKKIWVFYPSEQAQYLYNGVVNPFNPDLVKYPEFAKAKPLVCVQSPGEIVFTPSGWWHAVYNEVGGVSITENYINDTNYDVVKMTLLYHNKLEEAKIVDSCMQHYMSTK